MLAAHFTDVSKHLDKLTNLSSLQEVAFKGLQLEARAQSSSLLLWVASDKFNKCSLCELVAQENQTL